MAKIKFQADADLNQHIVRATLRREPNIDFQTATLANLEGLSDPEVLELSAREERIVVSHDQTTMPIHFGEFITSQTSPGLIIIPKYLSITLAVEDLILIWNLSETEEWADRIVFLPM